MSDQKFTANMEPSASLSGGGGLLYYIALEQIPGVGSILAKRLIAYCGSAEAVFSEKQKSLQKIPGIGDVLSREVVQQKVLQQAEQELNTVAVMACGLDKIYPAAHAVYAKQICEQGACVSDFISDTPLDRKNFLKRNRIIAGLSEATLVVESGATGGALVTADIAMSYNRDVLAVPGRVGDTYSAGCNGLIRQNKAALIESAADIEYVLGWQREDVPAMPKQLPLFHELSDEERLIVDTLKKTDSENIDALSYHTDIPMSRLSSILLNLEFNGMVKTLPGKQYALKR